MKIPAWSIRISVSTTSPIAFFLLGMLTKPRDLRDVLTTLLFIVTAAKGALVVNDCITLSFTFLPTRESTYVTTG